jgi:endo-1,4-beta-mannosidase
MLERRNPRIDTPEPWLGVNYWSRAGGPLMWRTYDDDLVRSELTTLAEHGLNLTRSFFYWPDFHPEPDTIDDIYVDRFRQFLQASTDLGLQTIPTFIVGHMSGANWDPAWRQGRNHYTDGFMLGQQAFFIREMVRRVTPSPAIAAWLISNEMPMLGGPVDHTYGRAWGLVCAAAVRAGGSELPVSLGDGVWTKEITGRDNGFRLRDQLDVVDFFGPHSYPMGTDPTRQLSRAAFICEAAQLGKPVVLEEFGTTDTFAAPDHAAHYYRHTMHQSLLAGATGWIGWNNTDFTLDDVEPYSSHLYELTFGITTTDGAPKPTLLEMQNFGAILEAVDAKTLTRTPTGTAVLFPAHADIDLPVLDADHQLDREVMPEVVQHAWIAARAADLSPLIVRESEQIPAADLLIVPANKALLGRSFPALIERAAQGAHVYVSWFAGVAPNQRGAWWPALRPVFGVDHRLRYGIADISDDIVTLTFAQPLGDLSAGSELTFRSAGEHYARAYLPIEVAEGADTDVIATNQHGQAALVRRRVGDGAIYLCVYPLEYFGAARENAHNDDEVWRLYRALAVEARLEVRLVLDTPHVFADHMTAPDATIYSWLVNTGPQSLDIAPSVAADTVLVDVLTGETLKPVSPLDAFAIRVVRHDTR